MTTKPKIVKGILDKHWTWMKKKRSKYKNRTDNFRNKPRDKDKKIILVQAVKSQEG